MKKNILIFFAFFAVLFTYSCNNDTTESNEKEAIQTRALSQSKESESESASYGFITQKWGFGEEYIDLAQEGTFEAMLDGNHIEGRWGLSTGEDDQRTLELIGKEDDGKTNSFHRTYELITVSYDRLVAVDSDGNKINFYPEDE